MQFDRCLVILTLTTFMGVLSKSTAAATCYADTMTYGAKKAELAEKKSATWVLLQDIQIEQNTIGYGPGGATAFETTIYDGKMWLAQADVLQADGVWGRHHYQPTEGNVFAVTATAESWMKLQHVPVISSLASLNLFLDKIIMELGCDQALLPFKVIGRAKMVEWSIESNPDKKSETYHNEPVVLVGIYSSGARDSFFAVGEMNIHLHAIFPNRAFAAHVNQLVLEPDAEVYVGQ